MVNGAHRKTEAHSDSRELANGVAMSVAIWAVFLAVVFTAALYR